MESTQSVTVSDERYKDQTFNDWDDYELSIDLQRGIVAKGFEKPSPIQRKGIQPIRDGSDVIAQAQSGTGKTATFTIGCLSSIDMGLPKVQAIILCNTHELANQIAEVVREIGAFIEELHVQTLIGGSNVNDDISKLKATPPQVVVGTPGRVYDILRRRSLIDQNVKMLILDEADEMLSGSFKEQVKDIFGYLSQNTQVILFSATFPPHIESITKQFMRDPVKITVKAEQLTLEGIKQYFVVVDDDEQKYNTLKKLYEGINIVQCMIYANSVNRVNDLYTLMQKNGFPVCCLHRNMEKHVREDVLNKFRQGEFRIMISTNLTARGIDIQQVSLVINFDVPMDKEIYLHRIGRSGRWGRKGTAINFVTRPRDQKDQRDVNAMRDIETHYATQIDELPANFKL